MTKINSKHGEDATITQLLERIQQHSIEAYRELEQYKNSEKRQKRTIWISSIDPIKLSSPHAFNAINNKGPIPIKQ